MRLPDLEVFAVTDNVAGRAEEVCAEFGTQPEYLACHRDAVCRERRGSCSLPRRLSKRWGKVQRRHERGVGSWMELGNQSCRGPAGDRGNGSTPRPKAEGESTGCGALGRTGA